MSPRVATKNPAALSYYMMRRAVGIIALSLPLVLACGSIALSLIGPRHELPHPLLQRSISDYYYTPMGDYLVGNLFAIAAFLVCTRGYDLSDEVTGYVSGICAFGVALVPSPNPYAAYHSKLQVDLGFVHTGFAALMFLALAYFCLVLFRRTSPEKRVTRRKRHRNRVYRVCGVVMIVCITVIICLPFDGAARLLAPIHPLFGCETLSLAAFGVAWLTKGEGILKDKVQNHNHTHKSINEQLVTTIQ
jgi:hypothetical protein